MRTTTLALAFSLFAAARTSGEKDRKEAIFEYLGMGNHGVVVHYYTTPVVLPEIDVYSTVGTPGTFYSFSPIFNQAPKEPHPAE